MKGEPAPTFTWSKEGKVVEAMDGVVVKTVSEHPDPAEQSCIVSLQLLRTQMEDAGKFTLTATNKSGTDQAYMPYSTTKSMSKVESWTPGKK